MKTLKNAGTVNLHVLALLNSTACDIAAFLTLQASLRMSKQCETLYQHAYHMSLNYPHAIFKKMESSGTTVWEHGVELYITVKQP